MAQAQKGKITQVIGGSAIIRPFGFGAALTPPLPTQTIIIDIPSIGTVTANYPALVTGADVIFVLFEDGTGAIIAGA